MTMRKKERWKVNLPTMERYDTLDRLSVRGGEGTQSDCVAEFGNRA